MEADHRSDHAEHARSRLVHDPYWAGLIEEMILTGWWDHIVTRRAHDLGWTAPLTDFDIMQMAADLGAEEE